MIEYLQEMVYWHWWILAAVLLVIELMVPAAFIVWVAISATIMGVMMLIVPDMIWQWQLFLFAVLSVVSVLVGRHYFVHEAEPSDHPNLSRRGEQYVGRVFFLEDGISNGVGRVRVDDTYWRVTGDELPANSKVEVVAVEGATLVVKAHSS